MQVYFSELGITFFFASVTANVIQLYIYVRSYVFMYINMDKHKMIFIFQMFTFMGVWPTVLWFLETILIKNNIRKYVI